jgi:hypothetical protein
LKGAKQSGFEKKNGCGLLYGLRQSSIHDIVVFLQSQRSLTIVWGNGPIKKCNKHHQNQGVALPTLACFKKVLQHKTQDSSFLRAPP